MLDIKFQGTENPHYHVRNFLSAMTLKGIHREIFHIIFPWSFNKDVMRWYNTIDLQKVTSWDDLHKEFLLQCLYNADLPITLRDLELTM